MSSHLPVPVSPETQIRTTPLTGRHQRPHPEWLGRFYDARPVVIQTADRLGITPAQVALRWLLQLAPHVLLIPGTGCVAHLRENLVAERVTLDDEALRDLDSVGA